MEIKLEHVLLLLLFVFFLKMIMDKCGCRGKIPIEGYANMNECYRGWAHGEFDPPEGNGCPDGVTAVTTPAGETTMRANDGSDVQYAYIVKNRWGDPRNSFFWDHENNEPYNHDVQMACYNNLIEECRSRVYTDPTDAPPTPPDTTCSDCRGSGRNCLISLHGGPPGCHKRTHENCKHIGGTWCGDIPRTH